MSVLPDASGDRRTRLGQPGIFKRLLPAFAIAVLASCTHEQTTGITNGMNAASDFIFQNQIYQ